ncbi:TerC family protein [Muricoccus pecuniae]|uniref:Putative tellurium resistance membrane protein TerC n=1 Tax=Muricoccus pecuniae TaxID=693023 RepID=A0A840YEC5_9PROT|nr:TerC family protein [Roseomonas pecuniae]MBB5692234.1 putative tellurium resistance membrane protein TerC [Roseomonas pecuniae]
MEAEVLVALVALIGMEVVLGIDNLVFIAILTNRLPVERRRSARLIGLGLAVVMRLGMLAGVGWLISLTAPLFNVLGMDVSGKDLIMIAGGLFLIGKAVIEIHHRVDPGSQAEAQAANQVVASFGATVFQIILIDMVFSVDSILAAVGLTNVMWVIVVAILVSVTVMLLSMDALSNFMEKNPTVVMLALAFLVMIGMVLLGEGFGFHVPKGFVYVAMAFAAGVEGLNIWARRGSDRRVMNPASSTVAAPGQASLSQSVVAEEVLANRGRTSPGAG